MAVSPYPDVSRAAAGVQLSIFTRLQACVATYPGRVIPLQIGDTYLPPPVALHEIAFAELGHKTLYQYGSACGYGPLVETLTAKVRHTNAMVRAKVLITAGATSGLACAIGGLLNPGDELLVLTPHWPLITGIALTSGVQPIEVGLGPNLIERLTQAITPRTTAIYFSTPNNPCGHVMARAEAEALAAFAERHGLWILADEVYEDYAYAAPHLSIASLPAAEARTVTVFSFSKSLGLAGARVGYLAGPEPALLAAQKILNHRVYNIPVVLQHLALQAHLGAAPFVAQARAAYLAAKAQARAALRIPSADPNGGSYLFLNLAQAFGTDGTAALERIAHAGVLLAPGVAFGGAYGDWARLCYTSVPPAELLEAIRRINALIP